MTTAKRQQTRAELLGHLNEQMRLMSRSARVYDEGDFAEARRVATHLRTLLHDTPKSTSLLTSLGVLPDLQLCDTNAAGTRLGMPIVFHGMVMTRRSPTVPAHYTPLLTRGPPTRRPPGKKRFAEWWSDPVVTHVQTGTTYNRREFVLYVANQDGGAHVDPAIDEKWALLTRDHAFNPFVNIRDGRAVPLAGFDLAHVVQISYEVFITLRERPELLPPGGEAVWLQ